MIAFDATATGNVNAASLTYSHTCSGSNRILLVGVGTDASADCITGATYNGVAMTLIDKQQMSGDATRFIYLFYLINPASGANDIVVSASGGLRNIRSDSVSYTGAKQSGQPDASAKATNASTTDLSVAVTVVAANSWIVSFGNAIAAIPVAGTGLTSRNTEGANCRIADSNGLLSAGSNTVHWTRGAADAVNAIAASIAAAQDDNSYILIQA